MHALSLVVDEEESADVAAAREGGPHGEAHVRRAQGTARMRANIGGGRHHGCGVLDLRGARSRGVGSCGRGGMRARGKTCHTAVQ